MTVENRHFGCWTPTVSLGTVHDGHAFCDRQGLSPSDPDNQSIWRTVTYFPIFIETLICHDNETSPYGFKSVTNDFQIIRSFRKVQQYFAIIVNNSTNGSNTILIYQCYHLAFPLTVYAILHGLLLIPNGGQLVLFWIDWVESIIPVHSAHLSLKHTFA